MPKHLLIVESPAKAKTIKKYLGKDFVILASYGHMRDLLPKSGSVDPENNFAMKYQVVEKNASHVNLIAKTLKSADSLYLATDPDREGEAISWHIYQLMRERNLLNDKPIRRVVFHEITKKAVLDAVSHPQEISMDLVNAQQERRALDYLVGFNLSPLRWKKIRRGLSAGRVQSPALRLIAEREQEIEQFISKEYWTITADCLAKVQSFTAKLIQYKGKKLTQFSITVSEQAALSEKYLLNSAKGKLTVSKVEKKQRKRNPSPPFITSTLQQEAAHKLGFTTRRTMVVAQQLYEGIDIGTGTIGLITYMRTDSVSLSNDAVTDIRHLISQRYGKNCLPPSKVIYKTKSKNAQEAHEAIRPTTINQTPKDLQSYLSAEQFKLYELIWQRTLACQMNPALIDTVTVDLDCGTDNQFRATGSTIAAPGFLQVYEQPAKVKSSHLGKEEKLLPIMKQNDWIDLIKLNCEQHFTEPPPRYSEASLVKTLEECDIGRPSTYAPIIQTLQNREYVTLEKKRFHPTDIGRIVNRFLTQHFTQYIDYDFTANLEDQLDAVSRGEKEWIPLLDTFWRPFIHQVGKVDAEVKRRDVTTEKLKESCPQCGKGLVIRLGKLGRFIGCSAYPDCDYTANIGEESKESKLIKDRKCPQCSSDLQIKAGKYGKFIGCSNYPDCKFIEPLEKPTNTGVACPNCHQGSLLKRKSKRGKIFYSCSTYPSCDYALWNEPITEICPKCSWPILTIKVTKRNGQQKICPHCKYAKKIKAEA